jgi:hypothetical protein
MTRLAQQATLTARLLALPLDADTLIAGIPVFHAAPQEWRIHGRWYRRPREARHCLERLVGTTRLYGAPWQPGYPPRKEPPCP